MKKKFQRGGHWLERQFCFLVAAAMVLVLCTVVLGACAACLPLRWIIDRDVRYQARKRRERICQPPPRPEYEKAA